MEKAMSKMISKKKRGLVLDKEEREIFDASQKRTLHVAENEDEWKNKLVNAALATVAKTRHISIRLSEKDLAKLKTKAIETGIPYQTLIGAVLHQYAEGKIRAFL